MDRGYIVTPQIGENPDGSEYVADYNVSTQGHSPVNTERFYQEDNGDYVFNEEQYDADLEEVSNLEADESEVDYDQDYVDAIFELYPNAMECLAIAADVFPPEEVEAYNKALDEGDWDVVVPFLERITSEFGNQSYEVEDYEEDESSEDSDASDDEWSPEESEQLDVAVNELMDTTPDFELSEQYQQIALQAQDQGDEVLAAVAAATSAFHSSDLEAEEAIDYILATYPKEEVMRVYQLLAA